MGAPSAGQIEVQPGEWYTPRSGCFETLLLGCWQAGLRVGTQASLSCWARTHSSTYTMPCNSDVSLCTHLPFLLHLG